MPSAKPKKVPTTHISALQGEDFSSRTIAGSMTLNKYSGEDSANIII